MAEENLKWMPLLKHHTTQMARLNTKMVEAACQRQAIREDFAELKHGLDELNRRGCQSGSYPALDWAQRARCGGGG